MHLLTLSTLIVAYAASATIATTTDRGSSMASFTGSATTGIASIANAGSCTHTIPDTAIYDGTSTEYTVTLLHKTLTDCQGCMYLTSVGNPAFPMPTGSMTGPPSSASGTATMIEGYRGLPWPPVPTVTIYADGTITETLVYCSKTAMGGASGTGVMTGGTTGTMTGGASSAPTGMTTMTTHTLNPYKGRK